MACDGVLAVKILELLFCLACMIYMRVTDYESRQVFYLLEKLNQEWPLLNSVTWEENGAIFTHIVFGSYIIITLGLLIGYLCGELKNGRIMEKYFLGMGALLFIIVGSLIFASLDSVPYYLVKNAAALGTIALLTGLLFILDMGLSRPKPPRIERLYKATQTETPAHSVDLLDKVHRVPNGDSVIGELRSSLKNKRPTDDDLRQPQEGGSIPDLTIHENGRGPSIRSRGIPDEPTTPESYRPNGHFYSEHERDFGRHSRGHMTPESSLRHDSRFPADIVLHPKRTSQDQPEHRYSSEYVTPDRGRDRRSTSVKEHGPPESIHIPSQRTSDEDVQSPSELDPQHKRASQEQMKTRHSRDADHGQSSSVREQKPPDGHHFHRHLPTDQDNRNSNSSSGDQRYLEQSEISQRPESITPEERHRSRPSSMYQGSDSEVDDLMRVPTVSFLLTERGEQIEAHPGGGKRSIRLKPQGTKTGSTKDLKLLPMLPIASTSKDIRGSLKSRSADTIAEDAKRKQFAREDAGSPASVGDEREKEKYLFGGRPKLSSNRSLDVEAGRLTRFDSPSPDVAHWRYDSRDANLIKTERELPSSPSDPGFVRHAAHNWPESSPRTPSQSPAGSITTRDSRSQNWPESRPRTPSQSPQNWPESTSQTPSPGHQVHWPQSRQSSDEGDYATAMPPQRQTKQPVPHHAQEESTRKSQKEKQKGPEDEDDDEDVDMPSGGSLTTQLLQKWLKQRKSKTGKTK